MPTSVDLNAEPDAPAAPATPDIFLSPRVVDAAAFEQFTGALRALVGQASAQDEALRGRLSKSESVLRQLAQAAPAEPRAQAEVLTRVEELRARVDQVLARPAPAEPVDLEGRLSAAEARLAALVDQAIARIHAAADAARTERARSDAHTATAEYEESWRDRIAPLTEHAALETANLEARLRAIEDRIASFAGPMLRSLAVLGGRAAVLLGRDPEAEAGPAAPGSLADLVARAERLTESARFAIGQLESIRAQAEHTQGSLASTLDASAGTIELLARRQQELGRALLETVHTTEQARESLESRARQFLKAIESPPPPDPSTPEPSPPSRRHGRS
jgi:chromosome segregation ATPase